MAKPVDEKTREAVRYLLQNFWISREQDPELYHLVQEQSQDLRNFFMQKMGLTLQIHRQFVRLLKVPVAPDPAQGIPSFNDKLDYVLFCCLLAYMEDHDQFLLQKFCEDQLCPNLFALDWTKYNQRMSLIRAIKTAISYGLLQPQEGEIDTFSSDNYQQCEVLLDVTDMAPYFMRVFSKSLTQYKSADEFKIHQGTIIHPEESVQRRHRIYRWLLFSPAVHRTEIGEEDFQYLRKHRHRIQDDFNQYTDLQLEIYNNVAFLVYPEDEYGQHRLPVLNKTQDNLVLLFAREVRRKKGEQALRLQPDGSIHITYAEFENWLSKVKDENHRYLPKKYRVMKVSDLSQELLLVLKKWKMATMENDTDIIQLQPLLGRCIGHYRTQ